MNGKLIVLEGTDGSGKSTQFRALCQRLDQAGIAYRHVVFPRYDQPSSALIRMYLGGDFGTDPANVNAYAASAFYAVDRYASYKQDWESWYLQGGLVLCDRYTTSNAVHQAGKVAPEERESFLHWLYDFEFGKLGLPAPDLVLYLDMPTDMTVHLLRDRETATHTQADIHERDTAYLTQCRKTAQMVSDVLGWEKVPCTEGGNLRTIGEISQDIWDRVSPLLNELERRT